MSLKAFLIKIDFFSFYMYILLPPSSVWSFLHVLLYNLVSSKVLKRWGQPKDILQNNVIVESWFLACLFTSPQYKIKSDYVYTTIFYYFTKCYGNLWLLHAYFTFYFYVYLGLCRPESFKSNSFAILNNSLYMRECRRRD